MTEDFRLLQTKKFI